MDAFTIDTLQKYIKCHKRGIILKLANEKFTDQNVAAKSDLINMVLDYSPTIKSTIQYQEKINLTRLRAKPSIKRKMNKSIKLSDIKESREDEDGNSKNNRKDDNKDSSSQKDSSSISFSNSSYKNESGKDNKDFSSNKKSFHAVRLSQKKLIRIYVLSTNNYFEIDFTPEETILALKKKILNKLENAVNVTLKHHLTDAYEVRSTKGMNVIYLKSKSEITESKEKCEPDMESPPINDKSLIKDVNKDALCFLEKQGYTSYRKSYANEDSMIEDNKKVYGEIISDTGESKVNCKIFIKIDKNSGSSNSKVVNVDSNMCLKDVFEKISNYANIKDKNSDFYYFVEHSEGRDNENMDEAINPDLEVKYLSPYILDLYQKKFADAPNINRISSYSINLNDDMIS